MKCNPLKCNLAVQETDFLGHWMTPDYIKALRKMIKVVLRIDQPRNATQAHSFIGAVNFYRSLWPRQAHVLSPLSELTGTKPFSFNDEK